MKDPSFIKRAFNLATAWRRKPVVGATPADAVFAENKWRLLRYRTRPEGAAYRTPLLLVPSLINRHYVLDLMPGKSLVEWLVQAGHDVFVIDWGTPTDEDRYLSFDEITGRYLGRALRQTCRIANAPKAHVLGYCLGGTLAAIHAAAYPERIASLTALAAPVSFENDGLLAIWTRSKTFDVDALVDGGGNVSWQLMQTSFNMLRPTLGLRKAVSVVNRAWDDQFLDGFFALEAWGNDNVSFPGECYRRYIQALYRDNQLALGTFTLNNRPARLENVRCPLLTITFEHDNIVPWRSASLLHEQARSQDKEHLHLAGGHVGAVVSRAAKKHLWPQLSAFWAARDQAGANDAPLRLINP